jgi:hypothetical protein
MISSTSRIGARAGVLSLVAMLCLSAACDNTSDDGMEAGETGGGALSYADDIQPIWEDNCTAGCHMPGGTAAMVLDLSTADSYDSLVGSLSGQATTMELVEAGSSANSYLVAKLRGTQTTAGGTGGQMPLGTGGPLPEATIALIEQWVDDGAAP